MRKSKTNFKPIPICETCKIDMLAKAEKKFGIIEIKYENDSEEINKIRNLMWDNMPSIFDEEIIPKIVHIIDQITGEITKVKS
jgi:hypothetical protein